MDQFMRNYTYPAIIIILMLMLLFSVGRCRFNMQNADANFSALADSITHFTNRLGTQSASIKTLQMDKLQLEETVIEKDKQLAALTKKFSQVKTIVQYSQLIKYDTITVRYKDSVPCTFKRLGNLSTKWYCFNYTATQSGFIIDSLSINNQATVITGFKRSWFLGKETLVTDVTNTNPYVKVTTLNSVEVVVPSPWYKKWYVWLGAGIVGRMLAQ